eukprot:scaffold63704_cov55-Phaeocystis_antarctica.AAC.4
MYFFKKQDCREWPRCCAADYNRDYHKRQGHDVVTPVAETVCTIPNSYSTTGLGGQDDPTPIDLRPPGVGPRHLDRNNKGSALSVTNRSASLMLAAASLLLSGKRAAPDDHVRFAQNNAFTEQEVSCYACTRALTTRVQPHTRSQA